MSDLEKNSTIINFEVSLKGFEPPQDDNLKDILLKYINKLVDDLGIPAKCILSLEYSDSIYEGSFIPFEVSVNGKNCRTPFFFKQNKEFNYNALASDIMEIIHNNRELLITREISLLTKKEYTSEDKSNLNNLSDDIFYKLLITMVKHGFKLERCKDFRPASDTIGSDYLHYFDTLIAEVDSTNIKVTYNKAYEEFNKQALKDDLNDMFILMQDGLFYELGIVFPKVKWEVNDRFDNNEFQFQINDVTYPSVLGLSPNECLVNDTVDRLTLLNVKGKAAINPANGSECAIINAADAKSCESAGLTTWDPPGYLILYLSHQLRKRAGSFLTKNMVKNVLDSFSLAFPDLVKTVLGKYDLFTMTWILRDLVEEEISIRDLRNILDNLLCINGTTNVDLSEYNIVFQPEGTHLVYTDKETVNNLDFTDFSDYIRAAALNRYISHKYTRGGNALLVYLLDPEIEYKIRDLKGVNLSDESRTEILDAVFKEVGDLPPTAQNPVFLTTYEIRRPFRKLINIELPYLAVLCYQELSPDTNIQRLSTITLN